MATKTAAQKSADKEKTTKAAAAAGSTSRAKKANFNADDIERIAASVESGNTSAALVAEIRALAKFGGAGEEESGGAR